MTDRELLELAAKAAGIVGHWEKDQAYKQDRYYFNVPYDNQNMLTGFRWDPLTDDGEALRLAVTKRFGIKDFAPHDNQKIVQAPPDAALWGMVEIWREDDDDPLHVEWYKAGADRCAATRRAIVRAAAELGRAL